MPPWYRSGTVAVINGSPTVVGTGTLFTSQASAGDIFIGPDLAMYEITVVPDDTHLSIKTLGGVAGYNGATLSNQAYAVVRNFTSTTNAQLAGKLTVLLNNWQTSQDQFRTWLGGTVNGGPANDGKYPLTDALGNTYNVDCLAKIAAGKFAAGTAAGPSISTTGDTNTGLFFPAADVLAVATAGGERARFGTGGNFLVGLTADDGVNKFQLGGTMILGMTTDATNKSGYIASQQYSSTAEPEGFFVIGGYGYNGGNQVSIGGLSSGYNAASLITLYTAADAVTRTGTERARVTSTGNFLIGTTTETTGQERLQVMHGTALAGSFRSDTANTLRLWRYINTGSAAAGRLLFGALSGTNNQADYASINGIIEVNTDTAQNGSIAFNTATAGSVTEKARLLSNGNLLIGTSTDNTTTGAAKLQVTNGIYLGNSANAAANVLDWYEEGTYIATATGMTTSPTATFKYTRVGNVVTLDILSISGTSNATTYTVTGAPAQIRPAGPKIFSFRVTDNGVYSWGYGTMDNAGTISFYKDAAGSAFTNTGTKGNSSGSISFTLA